MKYTQKILKYTQIYSNILEYTRIYSNILKHPTVFTYLLSDNFLSCTLVQLSNSLFPKLHTFGLKF